MVLRLKHSHKCDEENICDTNNDYGAIVTKQLQYTNVHYRNALKFSENTLHPHHLRLWVVIVIVVVTF